MSGKKILIVFIIVTSTISCGVDCDNAELCIKNNGTDTAYCNFDGSSQYTDTIPPGGSACIFVGHVSVHGYNEQVVWVPVNTSSGNYNVKVAKCNAEYSIE